jgi:hypothetical protein
MVMSREPECIYSTTYEPDITNASHVLAFLLVPESLFFAPDDDMFVRSATCEMLREAKRNALLEWYRRRA